jgi:hypothetical protein
MKTFPDLPSKETRFSSNYSITKAFISHISEEAEVAQKLARAIEEDFHGVIEVYVSSEPEQTEVGEVWLTRIERELEDSSLLLILCSKYSIERPWINFEAGAAWLAGKILIPICHQGMTPDKLPIPFSNLQGMNLREREDLRSLYAAISRILGWRYPPKFGDKALEILRISPNYGRRWQHHDLTMASKAKLANSDPWAISIGHKQHVIFVGENSHIYELTPMGYWNANNLTVESGALAPTILEGAKPSGYDDYGILHVVYWASDKNIFELWWGNKWHHNNLTKASSESSDESAPLAAGIPAGYAYYYSQHVVYRGEDSHIHELWWNDTAGERKWQHTDLLYAASSNDSHPPEAAGDPIGLALGHKQHVIYRGIDGHIHELWWDGGRDRTWHHTDLMNEIQNIGTANIPTAKGDPSVYIHDSTLHIVYRDINDDIQELWWNDGWQCSNLMEHSRKSDDGIPKADSNPFGYIRGHNQHVIYRDKGGNIHELVWDYGWNHYNLMSLCAESLGSQITKAEGDPVGYALSGSQNVIYRGTDNHIHQLLRM